MQPTSNFWSRKCESIDVLERRQDSSARESILSRVKDLYKAPKAGFQRASERLWRSIRQPSTNEVGTASLMLSAIRNPLSSAECQR